MTHPITYGSRAGLLALLLAPAVDRWWERFDAWLEGRFNAPKKVGK